MATRDLLRLARRDGVEIGSLHKRERCPDGYVAWDVELWCEKRRMTVHVAAPFSVIPTLVETLALTLSQAHIADWHSYEGYLEEFELEHSEGAYAEYGHACDLARDFPVFFGSHERYQEYLDALE